MTKFVWIEFYMAFADTLLEWHGRKRELYEAIKSFAAGNAFLNYLHFDNAELWAKRGEELDPFTVMGIFNRGTTAQHRYELGVQLAGIIGLKDLEPPRNYAGIAHLDPRKSIYDGPEEMWALFVAALSSGRDWATDFAGAWERAVKIKGNGLGTLSIGLYWVRPQKFLAVDRVSAPYVESEWGFAEPGEKCTAGEYLDYLSSIKHKAGAGDDTFPEVALAAWIQKHGK